MSYSQMQSVAAMHPRERHVQTQLRSLVERLGWSYVALWSLNHQSRNLGWKGGHFRGNSTAEAEVWNEQLFSSTYKSCQFTHGLGSVGTAHAEGRNIWMNGPSVLKNAGSKDQADFLQHARIATAMCIPWTDGVLEVGTCDSVPENLDLMENIRQHMLKHIVPAVGQPSHSLPATMHTAGVSQAPPDFPQSSQLGARSMMQQHAPFSSLNPMRHVPENLSTQIFEPNSLNQQIRRTASLPSLNTDMFLQHPEDATEGQKEVGNELDTDMLLNPDSRTWRLPTSRAPEALPTQQAPISATVTASHPNFQYYPPAQQKTRGQYRSRSGTTSSSVSSLEECSAKQSADSPEQNLAFLGASSQRHTSHSNTSSSPRRGASSHSPEMNQLEDTTTKTGAPSLQESARVDDFQTAISLILADGDDPYQWRNIYNPLEPGSMSQMNLLDSSTNEDNHSFSTSQVVGNAPSQQAQISPVLQTHGPFKSWRHTRILAPILQKNDRTNQELLRRCIDMMKQIPNLQQGGAQPEGQAVVQNVGQQGPRVASSSSPETVPDIGIAHDPFDQPDPPRAQRRPRGGSRIASMGPVHTGHDEAAMNHMMAERRRRVKQKENFTALRRLVPIISKADKASILGDAIVYLKDLQEQIKELEASRAETQRRYESLQISYKDLEQRNQELEAMAASSNGGTHSVQRSTRGIHSMQSF